jgi:hypothetical protein
MVVVVITIIICIPPSLLAIIGVVFFALPIPSLTACLPNLRFQSLEAEAKLTGDFVEKATLTLAKE